MVYSVLHTSSDLKDIFVIKTDLQLKALKWSQNHDKTTQWKFQYIVFYIHFPLTESCHTEFKVGASQISIKKKLTLI